MSGERVAVEAALAIVGDELELDLFGLPTDPAKRDQAIERRVGRPKGARNKRTERTVALLLSRYQDPRAVLLAIAETPVHVLAEELGCTLLEALQEKRLAAGLVLPYVAQKQPLAVNISNREIIHLHILNGQVAEAPDAGAGVAVRIMENVAFQEVAGDGSPAVGQVEVGQEDQDLEKPE